MAGLASLVLALWLAIPPIGWAALLWGFPLWTIIVSVPLFRRGGAPTATSIPPAP